ncbi:MAG: SUMF1/EgtB/PvdO family nonheme iron enzyme [Proteobacteria bacterium]|nr:SUMF1/EgtB/PvdO family nonheme iron enzyme [Pseudomonadota bacterium]
MNLDSVFETLGHAWHWLHDDPQNLAIVVAIGAGFAVIVKALWTLFTRESNPKPTPPGISKDALPSLLKRLTARRNDRADEIAEIGNVFSDPLLLAKYYVVPNCQHHNPADYHEDEGARSDLRTPFFDYISKFLEKEVTLRNGGHQLFILADAGMGKTSVLMMLKLVHLYHFWRPEYDCLLLKLGTDTLDKLRLQQNKAKTVLLLDALDEDPTAWGRFEQRLSELLLASENFRHVLISCRTQFFPETGSDPFRNPGRVTVGNFICPMIFLSLFDDRQVDEYLLKRFPLPWHRLSLGKVKANRLKAKEILAAMHSLRFRPLLLAHIDDILKSSERKWNEYTVYEALLEAWLLREGKKLEQQNIQPLPSKDDLWAACTVLALHMQTLGLQEKTVTQEQLRSLVGALPAIAHIEHFDFGGRSLLNRNSQREYRFAHYSIQEFLVAHALVAGGLDKQMKTVPALKQGNKLRATDQILAFLKCQDKIAEGLSRLDFQNIRMEGLAGWHFRDRLQDGSLGPVMSIIPGGRFLMGSPENEAGRSNNERQHEVEVESFAIGQYAVTFEEYDRFAVATGRGKPKDQGWGRGRHPVINVTWNDAVAYAEWLSALTGEPYRLPTEAEWEFACRAGTTTPFHFGETISTDLANYNGNYTYGNGKKGVYREKTVEVGQFPANAWGLHDMHGNVWEWTASVYDRQYGGAEWQVSADYAAGNRVVRGGSWGGNPQYLRSAYRLGDTSDGAINFLGFRLARALSL